MQDRTWFNIGNPGNQIWIMRETVQHLMVRRELAFSLMHMIAVFIDGLAKPARGAVGETYIAYLDEHFPNLCEAIPPEDFLNHFRNGSVHEFATRPPYGLSTRGTSEPYVTRETAGGAEWRLLNVDRLAVDFLRHLDDVDAALRK